MSDSIQLSERAESVLKNLVYRYINDGSPVGSRTLSKDTDLHLSPATIRNVMSDLEQYGLIQSPHASAGRVPTAKGYRFFINTILQSQSDIPQNIDIMDFNFEGSDTQSILEGATEMLSQITSFAGIVSTPMPKHITVRQVEFLKLSDQRILTILVTQDGHVQNKILSVHREYSSSELVEAANYFNSLYTGKDLEKVRFELFSHMHLDRHSMQKEMRIAIKMAGQLFTDEDGCASKSVLVSGEHNLLTVPEFTEMDKIRDLLDTLKTKQVLFDLLQKNMFADGVSIFIGEESGYAPFRDCSVIATPYEVDNQKVGVLGVIGPTRMQYNEVISAVDVTAKLIGNVLSSQHTQ